VLGISYFGMAISKQGETTPWSNSAQKMVIPIKRKYLLTLPSLLTFCFTMNTAYANIKDPMWIQDPVNYEVTKEPVLNKNVSVPILEYHEAIYTPGNSITLKPGQFLSEVEWLHHHDFHTINFGQLYAAMYYGYQLPSRPILLSFDDGYESLYLDVYPILKRYGYQATSFATSSFVHTQPNRKVKYPKLTVSELQTLQKSGVVDVESHSVHHLNLATIPRSSANYELKQSALTLSSIVGHPIRFFCYPGGGYNATDVNLVGKNGYLLATTQHNGYAKVSQGPLTLHRIVIYSTDYLSNFANKLAPSLTESKLR
jgi:peptidoglycan/xylan/chitin deacetylase (PgdA/CDA1 family)